MKYLHEIDRTQLDIRTSMIQSVIFLKTSHGIGQIFYAFLSYISTMYVNQLIEDIVFIIQSAAFVVVGGKKKPYP